VRESVLVTFRVRRIRALVYAALAIPRARNVNGKALLILLLLAGATEAQPRSIDAGVAMEQRLDQPVPLDARFFDEDGREATLDAYFGDKPVILVLAYYRCPRLCSLVLNGLVESLRALDFDAGKDFEIVVVSFDPREGPELAAAKKAAYVQQYGRPGAARGWHFLTGDEPNIRRLADAVGFRYRYDPQTDDYAHASGIMIVTPAGKLSRYLYGIDYPPRDLRLALVEASQNRIGSLADQVMLFCLSYDPDTGKYRLTALNLVRIGGLATVVLLTAWLIVAWRRERRARGQTPPRLADSPRGLGSPGK
jgi:protein SCO1/2